jgi:hypothetical protein
LKPATGKLAELEDKFIRDRKIPDRQRIVRLFDKYKRERPTAEQLTELERLLIQQKSENLQPPVRRPEALFSRT